MVPKTLGAVLLCFSICSCMNSSSPPASPNSTGSNAQPKHPVTEKMTEGAATMARKKIAQAKLESVQGIPVVIGGPNLPRPQFVLFILEGCPCSIDAQPIFNAFSKHWTGKVDFVGVMNASGKNAADWVSDYKPVFPVVSDPRLNLIHEFGAMQSVYSALLNRNGEIVKLWPGYSQDLLKEMNAAIAKEVGSEEKPFDAMYAPAVKTSGCYFPQ
jgi:hypothetical protein